MAKKIVTYDGISHVISKVKLLLNEKAPIIHGHDISNIMFPDGKSFQELLDLNIPPIVTKAEAELGELTTIRSWTPERVAQAVRGTILKDINVNLSSIITVDDTVLIGIGKLQGQVTNHKNDKSNPHNVDKAQVGLNNVDNTSDINKPVSIAQKSYVDNVTANLQTEITNRKDADDTLQDNINNINSSLQSEIIARQGADIAIQSNILNSVESSINSHNLSTTAHVDIRNVIKNAIGLPEWDGTNFILKFKTLDDTILEVSLPIEGLAKNIDYDKGTRELIITKQDGTSIRISIIDLVDIYVGYNGVHIQTIVDNGNIIKATLKAGSITETELSTALFTKLNNKADYSDLSDHINNKLNPHSVTKAQVGLGNVDNTSDLNKPISSAVQTALNGKQSSLNRTIGISDNTTGTITDTGGNLSIPMSITTTLGTSNATQLPAGTNSVRILSQRILDNLANIFNRLSTVESNPSSHQHPATDIISGRLILDRLPTSATANRILKVGTANSSPIYGQVDLSTDITGIVPLTNGGTGANNATAARNNLGVISSPVGSTGQVYYIKNDNSSDVQLSSILTTGRFVETAAELADETAKVISFGTIFNTWERFSIPDSNEKNSWNYNSTTDKINCTVNSANFIGFVSLDKYDSYTHEATLSSTDSDDDMIGIMIAYHKDTVSGKIYTLHATRSSKVTGAGLGPAWGVIYNWNQSDSKILFQEDSVLRPNSGWAAAGVTRLRVIRDGDIITCETTPFKNVVDYTATYKYTVNLTSDPILEKFRGPKQYGYCCMSQLNSTYSDIVFSDVSSMIFNINTNQVLVFKNGKWSVDSLKSVAGEVGVGRFLFNLTTRKLFFIQNKDTIIRISPWSVAEHQAALNALPNI